MDARYHIDNERQLVDLCYSRQCPHKKHYTALEQACQAQRKLRAAAGD